MSGSAQSGPAPAHQAKLGDGDRIALLFSAALTGGAFVVALLERAGLNPRPGATMCISRLLFGQRCPGCGLTDSFVALGHGDLSHSWEANPLGPVLFALLAAVVVTRLIKWRIPSPAWRWIDIGLSVAVAAALLVRTVLFYWMQGGL